jgi:hypothetical protein
MRTLHCPVSLRAITLLGALGTLALSASSCALGRTGPEPAISSLVVRNRGFLDVNIYAMQSAGAMPTRLGTVVGATTATFPLHAHDLQPGSFLVVRIRAIGSMRSWTSPGVPVGDGVLAVLDVNTDAFGDCSTSSLHTIITSDSAETPPFANR